MEEIANLRSFYKNKTILLTGHTGFKGSWLSILLLELGANIVGYSLEDSGFSSNNFIVSALSEKLEDERGDIRNIENLEAVFKHHKPDIVFHLAAQPLVIESYHNPIYTYETNVMGLVNVLECVRKTDSIRQVVVITTDKCYANKEQLWGYRETDPLGGHDPYSASKACDEIIVSSYYESFLKNKIGVASARSGNVIGGGDWAENRIVPDIIRAFENNRQIEIRNPSAVRPWQHVLEPTFGYLKLGFMLNADPLRYSGAYNFGPNIDSLVNVSDMVSLFCGILGHGKPLLLEETDQVHETNLLLLDNTKSKLVLDWHPVLTTEQAVKYTADWYLRYKLEKDMYGFCVQQMADYTNTAH